MRVLTRSIPLRIAILLWFSAWMIVVMPGHTRGIVQMPGSQTSDKSSCCQPKPSCCPTPNASCEQSPGQRPTDPAKNCAICFLKVRLTDPPPLTIYTPYLGELDELAFVIESSIADDLAAPKLLRGRGPPA